MPASKLNDKARESEMIAKLMASALEARNRAHTFNSSVGVSFEMYDGAVVNGFNIETYGRKAETHAEEVGIIKAMDLGYNGTDFRRMMEVFQDSRLQVHQIFPACPTCWNYMLEFTHPYLRIVVADTSGNITYGVRLKELFNVKEPAMIYPSVDTRIAREKKNFVPKLPLNEELMPFYRSDRQFKAYCDKVLKVQVRSA